MNTLIFDKKMLITEPTCICVVKVVFFFIQMFRIFVPMKTALISSSEAISLNMAQNIVGNWILKGFFTDELL